MLRTLLVNCLAVGWSMSALASAPGCVDPPVSQEELVQLIRAHSLAGKPFDKTFEVLTFLPRPLSDPEPAPDDWYLRERTRIVSDGNTLWQEMWSESPGELDPEASVSEPKNLVHHTYAGWNGVHAYLRAAGERSPEFGHTVAPGDVHQLAMVFNSMIGSYAYQTNHLKILEEGRRFEADRSGDVVDARWIASWSDNVTYRMRVATEPVFRIELLEVTVRIDEKHITRQKFEILSWEGVHGVSIPSSARMVTESLGASGREDEWSKVGAVYRREYMRGQPAEVTPTMAQLLAPIPGLRVYDARTRLAYEIGEAMVSLDGVVYQLPMVVKDHPGERVGEVLKGATINSGQAMNPGPAPSSPAKPSSQRLAVAGAAALGTGLLLIAALRLKRKSVGGATS